MIQKLNRDYMFAVSGGLNCMSDANWGSDLMCTTAGSIGAKIHASFVNNDYDDDYKAHVYCQGTDRGIYTRWSHMFCQENEMLRVECGNDECVVKVWYA